MPALGLQFERARRADSLSLATVNLARRFWHFSTRPSSCEKHHIRHRTANGGWEHHIIHWLECTQTQLYLLFKEQYPGVRVGRTLFCSLKPWYVRPKTELQLITCCCSACTNAWLLVKAAAEWRRLLDGLQPGEVALSMDFFENASFAPNRSPQSNYWGKIQATNFIAITWLWACDSDGTERRVKTEHVFISPDRNHSHRFVEHCVKDILAWLADQGCAPKILHTAHGKGEHDGVGALIKRAMRAVAATEMDVTINSADDLYSWCVAFKSAPAAQTSEAHAAQVELATRRFVFVPAAGEGAVQHPTSGQRYTGAQGQLTSRCFFTAAAGQPDTMQMRELSCYCGACRAADFAQCENPDLLPFESRKLWLEVGVGDVAAVVAGESDDGDEYWLLQVTQPPHQLAAPLTVGGLQFEAGEFVVEGTWYERCRGRGAGPRDYVLGEAAAAYTHLVICTDVELHHNPTTASSSSSGSLYTIVTDRFASPECVPLNKGCTCPSLSNYCGGTWQGMVDHLDYIQGLNLNAIWSSPVTAQSYGGYHGYWPVNLYDVNHGFGSADDLQRVLQELSNAGEGPCMFNVLDMVLNHVGYGSSIFLPPFNPFSDPSNFNNCTNCDTDCNIPDDGPTFEQQWDCRLMGLPDLNHSVPFVRTQLEEWTQWIVAQFSAHLLRLDAAGNIHPDFFPWYANTTDLVAWLEVGADVALVQQYEQVRDGAEYSYQGWSMAAAMNACFGLLPESFQPDIGCERLAALRKELWDMKVDTHNLGMWVENHDTDRFLTLRDNLPAYRNALAHVLLSESIPIIYYGAEQSMAGSLSNNTNRSPLWETGFSTAGPMYRFIRTLAWYRWWMTLGWETFDVRFTDRRTFAFSRGNKLLVVLTNGNYSEAVPRPAEYRLSGLDGFAGARLCDALHSGFCVDVSGNGIASVTPSPDDEPLVLVRQSWVKDEEFFTPLEHRPNDPGMVMHVALEYAVPHMGLTGQLQYGGLGKVVETFICHTARPMLVCAPMYAPFYGPDGRLAGDLANSGPLLSMTAVVGSERHLVEIYATAAPAGTGAGSGGAAVNGSDGAQPAGPTVFFLLLDSDVFRNRTRGTIYQHASEDEELAFFSVFNQAVAHTLRVASLQLHDYHGALSLLYLPHQLPLRVLLVAHNADYNGTWHLGTAAREAHVYDMLNVPINAHTRSLCEHSGRAGWGVVAVSPRYALRAHSKFSMFWDLPHACVIGILNGMEDPLGEVAAAAAAADPDAFFARKAAARLAFQEAKGLQVGEDFRLLVFMGRITHQLVMVGPIGDEYGEQAKHALEKVSADFPGRVWNGAGQYIMGADKEQLCMAADFFLCPSRFEPCGLADIEFG
ncbi:hypothetical protein C2E20_8791, partial [Micractinium conductrix]